MSKNVSVQKISREVAKAHKVMCSVDPSETTRQAPLFDKEIIAYFFGAIHDGTFSSNQRFRIAQKGTEWLLVLKTLLKKIGYNSWIYQEGKDRDIFVLETLANFLQFNFNPQRLKTLSEKTAYIRGFFDAEGGIPKKYQDRFYIQLTQNNKITLQRIKHALKELGVETGRIHNPSKRVAPHYWRIYVLACSHKTFIQKIGSWHPRKIRTLRQREMI